MMPSLTLDLILINGKRLAIQRDPDNLKCGIYIILFNITLMCVKKKNLTTT